jgi:hypothetical protein
MIEKKKIHLDPETKAALKRRIKLIENRLRYIIVFMIFSASYLVLFQREQLFATKINQIILSITLGCAAAIISSMYTISKMKKLK